MRRERWERFPIHRVSDPDMHHGTYVTHEPWCMLVSLTSGFLWSWWRGRHSCRMRIPQSYASGKGPMEFSLIYQGDFWCISLWFIKRSSQCNLKRYLWWLFCVWNDSFGLKYAESTAGYLSHWAWETWLLRYYMCFPRYTANIDGSPR